MAYRLPSSEELMVALYKALTRHGTIDSQRQLREAILRELRKWDQAYTVSLHRVRHAAIRAGFVNMEIMSREGGGAVAACPVCGAKLKTLRNRSLYGEQVTVGYRCAVCGYRSGVKKQVPTRYIFHLDDSMPRATTL